MKVDLSEFRSAFVAEADEHLDAIRNLLLEVERSQQAGKTAPRELRELMRLLHTIKGLSSMVGVDPVVILSHKMETVVRASEQGGGKVQPRALEVLLAAARAVEAGVRAIEQNRPNPEIPSALLNALNSLEAPAPVTVDDLELDPAIAEKLSMSEKLQLRSGVETGKRALRVDFTPTVDRAASGVSITTVRQQLGKLAEIVKVLPLARANAAGGLVFALLILTESTEAAVSAAVADSGATVHELVPPQSSPPIAAASAIVGEAPPDEVVDVGRNVLRVEVGRVDDAIEMLGELVVTRSRVAHAVDRLQAAGADTRELRAILNDNGRQLRELRASILRIRMVPLTALLDRLPLVVRGLALAASKNVRIELDPGDATELDKTVAERLFPALVHLMRNAIDHGVEMPSERVAEGKAATATIRVTCRTRERDVEIRIRDDGRGVDAEAVAARAGVAPPSTNNGLLDLLCRPGLSTRAEADTTSGRGLGMDIVRSIVHRLGGELNLDTVRGEGTTFTLQVPLTVAIIEAFTVRCRGERYAIPVPVVDEIVQLQHDAIVPLPQKKTRLLARRGRTIPLFDLGDAIGAPQADESCTHVIVVRRTADDHAAYAVDRVLGQQEIVVRPLLDPLVASPAISGSTDLGDGRLTVVLDLLALRGVAA